MTSRNRSVVEALLLSAAVYWASKRLTFEQIGRLWRGSSGTGVQASAVSPKLELDLTMHVIPGMAIDLPDWVTDGTGAGYEDGTLILYRNPTKREAGIALTWNSEREPPDVYIANTKHLLEPSGYESIHGGVSVGSHSVARWARVVDGEAQVVSTWTCDVDGRQFNLTFTLDSPLADVVALSDRIQAGTRCHLDGHHVSQPLEIPTFSAPGKWSIQTDGEYTVHGGPAGQKVSLDTGSFGDTMKLVDSERLHRQQTNWLAAQGAATSDAKRLADEIDLEGHVKRIWMHEDDESTRGAKRYMLMTWYCPVRKRTYNVVHVGPLGIPFETAHSELLGVSCHEAVSDEDK